ncbi:MAG: SCO family protein [Betaproteobacteria bacterium]|nr:SCO family protein [Betaproteobacteria bacterium]NBS47069.1 SCO family protein [Betaproteobacteria bacterium]
MKTLHPRTASRRSWLRCTMSLGMGLGALALAGCSPDKPAFRGIDITGADYARNFALPDFNGQMRTIADFKGKAVVVFFGFTQCPDVCPTAMSDLAQARQLLGKDGEQVQGIFITLDPERDTPEVLKAYATNFAPDFLALRGDAAQTEATAKAFKVYYKKVEGKTATSYTLDHSAGSYVFDTQGRIRLYTRHGAGAQALADDLKILLASR